MTEPHAPALAGHQEAGPLRPTGPFSGHLHGRRFDLILIPGVALLALLAGAVSGARPDWFLTILILNLWLLGYHHVMSTYTRLVFDAESRRRHLHLYTSLPLGVLAVTAGLAATGGAALIATIYLHWQWFHYTRQSEGIARAYAARGRHRETMNGTWNRIAFWSMPVAGMLTISARAPEQFLGLPVLVLPVPVWLADGALVFALFVAAGWLVHYLPRWLRGECSSCWTGYFISHVVIFLSAYVVVEHLNHGWLIVNIWHNAQYIAFVWLYNHNRYRQGVDAQAPLLSTLSQAHNVVPYLLICVALSTTFYLLVELGTDWYSAGALPLALIAYQAINFHHYIVDALVWKLRRPEVGTRLNLPA